MKNLNLLMISTVILMMVSCGGDEDAIAGSDTFWKCEVNGEKYKVEGTSAYAVDFTNDISIYGNGDFVNNPNASSMYIVINDKAVSSSYTLDKNEEAVGYYIPDFANTDNGFYTLSDDASGSLSISSNDGEYIEGTFEFTAVNFNTNEAVEITNGEFRVKISF